MWQLMEHKFTDGTNVLTQSTKNISKKASNWQWLYTGIESIDGDQRQKYR